MDLDRHTAGLFIEPSDIQRLGADGLNEVELEYGVNALTLDPTITTNGSYYYEDPDSYYYNANITVDVHPSQSLVQTISTNGSHTFTGEWTNAVISVDVHPSTSKNDFIEAAKNSCGKYDLPCVRCPSNINIDYFPTNFIVQDELLWYIDYECNNYMEEWNFENWGIKYWSKTQEFLDYIKAH